jgi:acyl-CoA reductase-like NAD-dependent aldehyde dehydrogenase
MTEKTIKFEKRSPLEMASEMESASSSKKTRLNILKTYKIYIDGKFPRTESGRYYPLKSREGDVIANISWCSRKDFRDAVTAARNAQSKWAKMSCYLRGQILYRIAEMLEGRHSQFVQELVQQGSDVPQAEAEVNQSIDRLVYYAGWADKYQQVFSAVNPVASSHFNFSILEPTGVVALVAPETSGLLGLVSALAPSLVGANTVVALASNSRPLGAVTFGEVLNSSDVPSGVVNLLTGYRKELLPHFASHMDVNALVYCGESEEEWKIIQENSILNLKRICRLAPLSWEASEVEDPYRILDLQEVKTTWHPIGI